MSAPGPRLFLAEPPSHYLARPPLVLDCSALAGILFRESWQVEAEQRILGRALHAPDLLYAEIANVAAKKQRRVGQFPHGTAVEVGGGWRQVR